MCLSPCQVYHWYLLFTTSLQVAVHPVKMHRLARTLSVVNGPGESQNHLRCVHLLEFSASTSVTNLKPATADLMFQLV